MDKMIIKVGGKIFYEGMEDKNTYFQNKIEEEVDTLYTYSTEGFDKTNGKYLKLIQEIDKLILQNYGDIIWNTFRTSVEGDTFIELKVYYEPKAFDFKKSA